jgi:pimeloyl-ACP methyl ester carboxylesterase
MSFRQCIPARFARGLAFTSALAGLIGVCATLHAQSFQDLQKTKTPLVLEALGSFYVGGELVPQTAVETGIYGDGKVAVDQMYVQYMIPRGHSKPPVVMVHGATLTGKSYETTPDGRMGWYEYFARKGYPSYVVDQVGRARSGFNQAPFNDVRAGLAPPSTQPILRRGSDSVMWLRFRIGPKLGSTYDDTQYPVGALDELAKQGVPDLGPSLPPNDPNYSGLSELARDLNGAVLMGHSQAARYPFETALLDPRGIRALISIEPSGCKATEYSEEQISKLARLPILIVFGDHLDPPPTLGPSSSEQFKDCQAFVARVNRANGSATLLNPASLGIHGNTHMIMQDRNNLQIADLIMKWIEKH